MDEQRPEQEQPTGANEQTSGPDDLPTDPDQGRGDGAALEGPADGVRARRRAPVAGATVALLIGLLAFALVVQIKSNTGDSQLESARQDDLVRILSDLNAREQRLQAEIGELEQTRAQLASGAQGREAALAQARRRADELGILAGTLAAKGEGLVIRLVPGEGPIRATTVLEAVEELRGAGAEAMQIAGGSSPPVRIVASTYFADGPNGLVVDGTTLTGPYAITVIGPASTMRTALTIPGGVSDAVARDGGNVLVDEPGEVTVGALHPPEPLEYARPVS
jgi:uncharacterized protein YlxW (UPF0749 family)